VAARGSARRAQGARLPRRGGARAPRRPRRGAVGQRDLGAERRPLPRRARDRQLAVQGGDAVGEAREPDAVGGGRRAADPVIGDLDRQAPGRDADADVDLVGGRVLRGVGERLGDEEVEAGLDRRRQPAVERVVDGDRDGQPRGERRDGRAEAAVGEDPRMDPGGDVAPSGGRTSVTAPTGEAGAASAWRPAVRAPSYSSGRSHTTDSGGSVSSAENGWPCQGTPSASTPPKLPTPEPP
jgi:hypothetical protein